MIANKRRIDEPSKEPAVIHPTAVVSEQAHIGPGTIVWHDVQVREGASVGSDCIIGKNVYVGEGVVIGNGVKVENNASVYSGATIEDGVFLGPHVVLTNDRLPRATTPDGVLKGPEDWVRGTTLVRRGASLGAGVVLVTGIVIGRWAMIGAGTVVVRDVPDHALVLGHPGRVVGFVCACGARLASAAGGRRVCPACESSIGVSGWAGE